MLSHYSLHAGRLAVKHFEGRSRGDTVLDGKVGDGYSGLPDGGLDVLRMPVRACSTITSYRQFGQLPDPLTSHSVAYPTKLAIKRQELSRQFGSQVGLFCSEPAGACQVSHKAAEKAQSQPTTDQIGDSQVAGINLAVSSPQDRVRRALDGQDWRAVTASSGVSSRTLSRLLRGESVKRSTLVALADTVGVSRVWLIDGTGPMRIQPGDTTPEGHIVVQGPTLPLQPPLDIIGAYDADRLASALKAAEQMFAAEKRQPTDRQRVQAMVLFYNHLTRLQAEIDAPDPDAASQLLLNDPKS